MSTQNYINDLNKQIYDKSWAGEYWGTDGAIDLSKRRYGKDHSLGNLSALSSTYYSAAGNAKARASQTRSFGKALWRLRAVWALWKAVITSNHFERRIGDVANMTADQLDVRATILRRARLYDKSLTLIDKALLQDIGPDTEVLLWIGRAEILAVRGREREAHASFKRAHALISEVKPTTSVRYYKTSARCLSLLGADYDAVHDVAIAQAIARNFSLDDQTEKLQALREEIEKKLMVDR